MKTKRIVYGVLVLALLLNVSLPTTEASVLKTSSLRGLSAASSLKKQTRSKTSASVTTTKKSVKATKTTTSKTTDSSLETTSDDSQVKPEKKEMSTEDKALFDKLKAAEESGDTETVTTLKAQLESKFGGKGGPDGKGAPDGKGKPEMGGEKGDRPEMSAEDQALFDKLKAAEESGDTETVATLKAQLDAKFGGKGGPDGKGGKPGEGKGKPGEKVSSTSTSGTTATKTKTVKSKVTSKSTKKTTK